jgi:hypothetical protein
MKSYGRAPTFLITTGNEQVRSIAAHLAGDDAAADEVQLVLPETGVCSSTNALSDADLAATVPLTALRLGFATAVPGGRTGDAEAQARANPLALSDVSSGRAGGCCG